MFINQIPNFIDSQFQLNIQSESLRNARLLQGTFTSPCSVGSSRVKTQWIGLRENLQETIDFPIKYGVFL